MATKRKVEPKDRPAFIRVSEGDDGGIKSISYGYDVFVSEEKDGDYYDYYIPAFNIYFFAKEEDAEKIGYAATTAFFNYWVKNQGKKAFLDEITRLGFIKAKQRAIKTNSRFSIRQSIPPAYNRKAFDGAGNNKIAA